MRTNDGSGEVVATIVMRLRRSTGCLKPSLPRVRMFYVLVIGTIGAGAVATVRLVVRPVPLATTWDAESSGVAAPAGLVEGPSWLAVLAVEVPWVLLPCSPWPAVPPWLLAEAAEGGAPGSRIRVVTALG